MRDLGLHGVSISDIMKAVDRTHGGFYGHFPSRDDLVAAALNKALIDGEASAVKSSSAKGKRALKSFANSYLSKTHRDNPRTGCAVSALASDVARSNTQNREIMSKHLERYFDNMTEVIGDEGSRDLPVSLMCMMVGAVTLSRVMTDPSPSIKTFRDSGRHGRREKRKSPSIQERNPSGRNRSLIYENTMRRGLIRPRKNMPSGRILRT